MHDNIPKVGTIQIMYMYPEPIHFNDLMYFDIKVKYMKYSRI